MVSSDKITLLKYVDEAGTGSIQYCSVSLLRKMTGSNQRTAVGRRWIPALVQETGQRMFPLAEE